MIKVCRCEVAQFSCSLTSSDHICVNKTCIALVLYILGQTSHPFSPMKIAKIFYNGKKQSIQLMTSLTITKQKNHNLNTIIKSWIAYAYYVVPFSKLDIQKLNKILSNFTKVICNFPKSIFKK